MFSQALEDFFSYQYVEFFRSFFFLINFYIVPMKWRKSLISCIFIRSFKDFFLYILLIYGWFIQISKTAGNEYSFIASLKSKFYLCVFFLLIYRLLPLYFLHKSTIFFHFFFRIFISWFLVLPLTFFKIMESIGTYVGRMLNILDPDYLILDLLLIY